MTRARCFALAVLFGACCLGPARGFAQGPPGYVPPSPYRTPVPMGQPQGWLLDSDENVSQYAPYGPEQKFDGGFLRVEYLHWNIEDPGNRLLGAPVAGVSDPREPFYVFPPGSDTPFGVATIPSTTPIALSDVNGIRATVGLELVHGGSIEIGAFMLAKKESGFVLDDFGETFVADFPFFGFLPNVVGTSTLVDGQVSDNILIYNQEYSAIYQSQLWGAEANWVGDHDREGLFWLNPTLGVRYFNLTEKLFQRGIFTDDTLGTGSIVSTIDSVAINNLYGPQFGARLELITKWISMGLDPKLMLLGNSMHANVSTNRLRSNDDPEVKTDDTTTGFSLGVDIGCYAQINFGPNFSARVGYNFIYLNQVTRPDSNIYYNDQGASNPPAIVTALSRGDWNVHGVSVGGELRY